MKKAIVLCLIVVLFVAGCGENESESEENKSSELNSQDNISEQNKVNETADMINETVNETEENEGPVCGDSICEETEIGSCESDCPDCDDNDICTEDRFDFESLECRNIRIKHCCGDSFCDPGEECEEDCPSRMLTLASYPYPFVHGDDFESELIVGDKGTSKEVQAASAIATSLNAGTIYGTLASEISTIKNKNVILIGNPCNNRFVAQLLPYENDCLEDYEEGEGRLSLFVTGQSEAKHTYALVVSGYSSDDIVRAAEILAGYEFNMDVLKGAESKV